MCFNPLQHSLVYIVVQYSIKQEINKQVTKPMALINAHIGLHV